MKKSQVFILLLPALLISSTIYAYPPHLQSSQQAEEDTKKYGPLRVQLGLKVKDFLNRTNTNWFLDTGTLLGAYRNGKTIPADDDFDISILGTEDELKTLFTQIKSYLKDTQYNARYVNTYCKKIEIFDKSHGSYILDPKTNTDFHNVTVDIQLYTANGNQVNYEYYKNNMNEYVHSTVSDILPLTTITFEGHEFNAPQNTEKFLKAHYGYIGPNAKYNPKTRMYEKVSS